MSNLFKGLNAFRDRFYQDVADEASARILQGNILDIGTGRGLLPIKIAQKNEDIKGYGVDISEKAIDAARKNSLASGLANAPQFGVGDVCALPFEDEFFDLVVSTFSLHHWPDATSGLNEIFRVLKPGGEAWIYDHWKDPSPEARERLRKDFGLLAAWFALAHLRSVSTPLTLEKAGSILQDPKLKFQKRRVEERGIILLMRLQKPEASG